MTKTVTKTCSVDNCDSTAKSRGWCRKHYQRWYRHRSTESLRPTRGMTVEEKFYFSSDLATLTKSGCSEWLGTPNSMGYGVIKQKRKTVGAHVVSWELANGRPVADGKQINHTCDNPVCVLPSHLYEGTQEENVHDAQKLTWIEVKEIRNEYTGKRGEQAAIAKRHKLSPQTICNIVNNKTWKEKTWLM